MSVVNIAGRSIGLDYKPLIVAEIGINHGGSLEVAKKMVLAARNSGCEMVKHQTHFVEDEMTEEAKNIYPPNDHRSIWDVIAASALTPEDELELKKYAENLGMIYISTPFSRAAADYLADIGVPAFKVGSGEVNHLPLIRRLCRYGKPIILSTGMQSIDGVRPTVEYILNKKIPLVLLQCTNLYPSPPEYVSLKGINILKSEFPEVVVGFSDHSIGPAMALAAVGLGACIVERHFTDDRYRGGPDISCSMDPSELKYLIDRSAEIHAALNNDKGRTVPEEAVYKFARGSVVADRDMDVDFVIKEDDIWARRPGNGEISVADFDKVIGKKLNCPVKKNQQLKWSDFF